MLEKIEAKLKEVMPLVFYGMADEIGNAPLWNYIVFFRETTSRNNQNLSYTDHYSVGIVCENWVKNEIISDVIEKLESLPGLRLASSDIGFDYARKPGTNAVVEVASIPFIHVRKKV